MKTSCCALVYIDKFWSFTVVFYCHFKPLISAHHFLKVILKGGQVFVSQADRKALPGLRSLQILIEYFQGELKNKVKERFKVKFINK